jgi:O-antigen/teichoic acid export membrane protein
MSKNQPSSRLRSFFKIGITGLKRLLKEDFGLIYTTLGGVGSTFLGAFFWFILASLISVDNYGLANYYIAIASIFAGMATIGLNITVTTYLAKGERKLLYEANSLTLVSGIASALVLSIFQWASGLLAAAMIFFNMTTAEILGRKTYKEFAFVTIGQRVAQITLGLVLYFQIGVIGIVIGYFLGSFLFSYKYLVSIKNFSFNITNLREKRNFALHSYGYSLIGQTLTNYLDKVLIGALFGYFALGLYQLGFQFFMFLSLIPGSLQQYLLPEESSGNSKHEIKILGLMLSVVASLAIFALCPYLIANFFPTFTDAIPLVSLMSLSVIPSTIAAILTASFLGNGKSKQVFTAGVIYLASLITCLTIMGLTIGILGLAIAVITAKAIQATYMVTQRNKPSPDQST